MRAYFFGNMYLSSIQQGLQSAHVVGDMAAKYRPNQFGSTDQSKIFYDWAEHHKTIILLDAGYGEAIHDLHEFFKLGENDLYPYAMFNESDAALDGAATCVGIVLTDRMVEGLVAWRKVRNRPKSPRTALDRLVQEADGILVIDKIETQYTKWEIELMSRISKFGLAR